MNGITSTELSFLITSLAPSEASPETLLAINRGHWSVENKCHYVRDVSMNEDRRYRKTNPSIFAAINNLALSLCRLSGSGYIPTFQRFFRADPTRSLRMLGVVM